MFEKQKIIFLDREKDIPIIIPTVTNVNKPKTIFIPGAMAYGNWRHINSVMFLLRWGKTEGKVNQKREERNTPNNPLSTPLVCFVRCLFFLF